MRAIPATPSHCRRQKALALPINAEVAAAAVIRRVNVDDILANGRQAQSRYLPKRGMRVTDAAADSLLNVVDIDAFE